MPEKFLNIENNNQEVWEKFNLIGEKLLKQLAWQEKNYAQTQDLLSELENVKQRLSILEDKTSARAKTKAVLKIIWQVITLVAGLWEMENSHKPNKEENKGKDFYSLLNLAHVWLAEKEGSGAGKENPSF